MRTRGLHFSAASLALLWLLSFCTASRPLTYASIERPEGPIVTEDDAPPQKFTVGRNPGFFYRYPADLERIFKEAEKRSKGRIIRNFDARLVTPGCFFFVCFGQDFVIVNNPEPDMKDFSTLN